MKVSQLLENEEGPIIYYQLKKLLGSGKEVIFYADPSKWDWRRDGILYIDSVDWSPQWPDVLSIKYYYQLRSGDFSDNVEEYELENIRNLRLKREGTSWVLYYGKPKPQS
jgi:hypothetical protein